MKFETLKQTLITEATADPQFAYQFPSIGNIDYFHESDWYRNNYSKISSLNIDRTLMAVIDFYRKNSRTNNFIPENKIVLSSLRWDEFRSLSRKFITLKLNKGAVGYFGLIKPQFGWFAEPERVCVIRNVSGTIYMGIDTHYSMFLKEIEKLFKEMRQLDTIGKSERDNQETTNRLRKLVKFGTEQEIARDKAKQLQKSLPNLIEVLGAGEANAEDTDKVLEMIESLECLIARVKSIKTFYGDTRAETKDRLLNGTITRSRKRAKATE
jgi:hypothetical protein